MNKQLGVILKFSTTISLLILASISICYVLEIFAGETAKLFAIKTIKVIGIIAITSILLMLISFTGHKSE